MQIPHFYDLTISTALNKAGESRSAGVRLYAMETNRLERDFNEAVKSPIWPHCDGALKGPKRGGGGGGIVDGENGRKKRDDGSKRATMEN